jgi:hypothetical protein
VADPLVEVAAELLVHPRGELGDLLAGGLGGRPRRALVAVRARLADAVGRGRQRVRAFLRDELAVRLTASAEERGAEEGDEEERQAAAHPHPEASGAHWP